MVAESDIGFGGWSRSERAYYTIIVAGCSLELCFCIFVEVKHPVPRAFYCLLLDQSRFELCVFVSVFV